MEKREMCARGEASPGLWQTLVCQVGGGWVVWVRQICCIPSGVHLWFWGCLFSGLLIRTLSWDKSILCCSTTISLVVWVNANCCFIIYNLCVSVSERWWPNRSDTLSFTTWHTVWNCWHKQLVYFVLTVKEDVIWNLQYF